MFFKAFFYLFWGSDFAKFDGSPFSDLPLTNRRPQDNPPWEMGRGKRGRASLALALGCLSVALSGCSANYTVNSAGIGAFQASTDAVEFGTVTVGQAANSSLSLINQGSAAVQITDVKVTGNGFAATNANTLPITVGANSTYSLALQFKPQGNGDSTGQLTVTTTSTTSPSLKVKLHGKGATAVTSSTPTLSSISCNQASFTGSGSDACTVTLTAAAASGGLAVSVSSNNSAVTVPGSVTVPAGSSSIGFTATVSAVTTTQSATLTASAGGTTKTYSIALSAYVPGLQLSTSSLSFGSVTVNTTSSPQSVTLTSSGTAPLTINSAALTGSGFNLSGTSFPVTLNPGQTATLTVTFAPTVTGTASGSITVSDNASPSTAAISLSGTGQATAGVLSGLSCANSSFTGAGSDACTVTLSAGAGTGGQAVSLSSNNSAVTVPGSVTVPAGSSSVGFTATVSAVTTAQSATLTASAGGITKTFGISLSSAAPSLTLGATTVSFGSVSLNMPANQTVTLTSSGTAALIISAGTVTGSGFSASGVTYPLTLNPGQTATLNIQFDPTTAGAATGTVTLTTNASPSTTTISLSGTGSTTSYQVDLTWTAPTNSSDPVAGYNIYRATGSTATYQLLNVSVDVPTAYTDSTVQSGTSYTYYVESVDAQGNQSAPSNTFAVSIP